MPPDPPDPVRDDPGSPEARRRDALLLQELIDKNMGQVGDPAVARVVLDAMRLKAELLGWLPPSRGRRPSWLPGP